MKFYFSRIEQVVVAVLLVSVLGGAVAVGYTCGLRRARGKQEPPFLQTTARPDKAEVKVVVHVTGAVKSAGVFTLRPSDRVMDAIAQAGGFTDTASPDALNLADKLVDGEKIYVPTKQEWQQRQAGASDQPYIQQPETATHTETSTTRKVTTAGQPASAATPPHPYAPKVLPTKPISLNSASLEQLQTLPGVGPVMAQHIVDYRTQHHGFRDVQELQQIPRIGEKTFAKMRPYVTL